MNENFRKILELVKESDKLSGSEKFELKLLLGKADRNVKSYDLGSQINCLKDLQRAINDPENFADDGVSDYIAGKYTEVINLAIERLSRDKLKLDYLDDKFFPAFDDYRPITFRQVLESLGELNELDGGIIFKPNDPNILDRTLEVRKDDGMGYAPEGPINIFCAYQEEEGEKPISFWI